MNIAILTPIIGSAYKEKCKYGTLSKEFYCYKNNYSLIIANEKDFDKIKREKKKYTWLKIYKLLELLDSYDYIFVSDADVSIMNYKLKLEDIINKYFESDTLMVITRDNTDINAGNFIIKGKNPLIKKYITTWKENLSTYYNYMGQAFEDQPALIHLIRNTEFKKYVKIIDQSIINSYPNKIKDSNGQMRHPSNNTRAKHYKKNDLLIHYAGFSYFGWDFSQPMKINYYKSLNYLEE